MARVIEGGTDASPSEFKGPIRVAEDVGQGYLTVTTGIGTEEALQQVDELVMARRNFRGVMARIMKERRETLASD